jgi:hypothetical protein
MKNLLFLFLIGLLPTLAMAQKNVVPVSSIPAFDITLPQGSKQDKRFLSVAAAASLLEAEISDPKVKLSGTEVYILPSRSASGFVADSLLMLLEKSGFQVNPLDNDNFAWVSKQGVTYFTFLSLDEKASNLYLAKANKLPDNRSTPSTKTGSANNTVAFPDHIPPLPPVRNSNPIKNQ